MGAVDRLVQAIDRYVRIVIWRSQGAASTRGGENRYLGPPLRPQGRWFIENNANESLLRSDGLARAGLVMANATVIVISILAFGVALSAAGVGVETATARCDQTDTCFSDSEPIDQAYACTYDAVFEGAEIDITCYVETNDDTFDEAVFVAGSHRSPVSANALVRVSINITRNAWYDSPNNYTLLFDREAKHVEWKGEDRFDGLLDLNQTHQHHETTFQLGGGAPPARLFVRFVYWDDTVTGVHEAALAIDVQQGNAPGPGFALAVGAVVAVAIVIRSSLRRHPGEP